MHGSEYSGGLNRVLLPGVFPLDTVGVRPQRDWRLREPAIHQDISRGLTCQPRLGRLFEGHLLGWRPNGIDHGEPWDRGGTARGGVNESDGRNLPGYLEGFGSASVTNA